MLSRTEQGSKFQPCGCCGACPNCHASLREQCCQHKMHVSGPGLAKAAGNSPMGRPSARLHTVLHTTRGGRSQVGRVRGAGGLAGGRGTYGTQGWCRRQCSRAGMKVHGLQQAAVQGRCCRGQPTGKQPSSSGGASSNLSLGQHAQRAADAEQHGVEVPAAGVGGREGGREGGGLGGQHWARDPALQPQHQVPGRQVLPTRPPCAYTCQAAGPSMQHPATEAGSNSLLGDAVVLQQHAGVRVDVGPCTVAQRAVGQGQ